MAIAEPLSQAIFQPMHTCYDVARSLAVWFIVQVRVQIHNSSIIDFLKTDSHE
jgi:hypothetical protein